MITERTIINALIIGATFILVPFIISSSLTIDYLPALFFSGLSAIIFSFFFLKDSLSLCPLIGSFFTGALNFLPLPLHAYHIACIMLVLYYVTGYVIIRQKKIKLGKPRLFWPILTITLILIYHNHNLHFGATGGSEEGAKPAYLIYLVVLGYFCGINIATPSVRFVSWVPFLCVILACVSCIPFVITSFVPALAPYLYYITDSVNVDAYLDTLSGTGTGDSANESIGRLGALAPLGYSIQLYLLGKYPIATWLRPERWWIAGLALVCVVLAVASGYRNVIFNFVLVTVVGTWCYYSWRSLFLPGGIMIIACSAIIASNNGILQLPVNKLPSIAQRSLSFIPANWDEDALLSAKSSNDFRKGIEDVYINEYLWRSPLIGTGYNIDKAQFDYYNAAMRNPGKGEAEYIQSKLFIEGKLFHTGWISVYDIVGIVGMSAFVFLGWSEICIVYHFLFGPKANRRSTLYPFYVWLMCNTVTMMVSFFTVFGDFATTFENLCIYAIVLSHLYDLEAATEVPLTSVERKTPLEYAGSKAGLYGYNGYNRYD